MGNRLEWKGRQEQMITSKNILGSVVVGGEGQNQHNQSIHDAKVTVTLLKNIALILEKLYIASFLVFVSFGSTCLLKLGISLYRQLAHHRTKSSPCKSKQITAFAFYFVFFQVTWKWTETKKKRTMKQNLGATA